IRTIDRSTGRTLTINAKEILVAAGRGPTTRILHPEKSGIKVTEQGWIMVNEYLETTQTGIWAFGDADGQHLFKHVANYESIVVYNNAVLKQQVKVDYHAVPHAVFTYPEVAAVGLREAEAMARLGDDKILIGYYRYEDTAKGEAINAKDYFVKVIVEADTGKILGGHIVGPEASILIHEIVALMNAGDQSLQPVRDMMHIHPSLSEVVDRAFGSLVPVEHYHHIREHEESNRKHVQA
ncbi:MAG TPA: FAD-dependent oxidoreductase, partial [Candidatus Binatus sp.]|nr:FAD-dependent oxidoreductase [Candidatus Binatus sp.]